MSTKAPVVSIVIVCMNRLDNLYPCLSGIEKHCSLPQETFVVAYLFSEDNLKQARRDFPWVKFIESTEIRGFSENNNLALRQAQGRYCFVLNDDTLMKEDTIARLVSDIEKLPESTAIVSPKLLNEDGSLQLCGRPVYPARKYLLQQWHCYKEPINNIVGLQPVFGQVYKTYNITGAAFLIKTDVFKELGFFDERYFFTPEDLALSTLARGRGYDLYVDADATIVHLWRTTASKISTAVRPAAVRGSLIFFSEGRRLKYLLLAAGVFAAEALKCAKAALRYTFAPSEGNKIKLQTFAHICAAILSCRSPKELFVKYYKRLRHA